jgi:predicted nucleic acid-binding protein
VLLIADTSVLINFLHVDRLPLIGRHKPRCAITDHVLAEVTDFYLDQQARLRAAIAEGNLDVMPVTADAEVELFARLLAGGRRLGAGECSAISVAINRGYALGIDDRRAIAEATAVAALENATVEILTTKDIVVRLIRDKALSVEQADVLLVAWRTQYRFTLPIKSFADLL